MRTTTHQIALLKGSIPDWNEWRKANPRACIDLRRADLFGADLRRASLFDVDLSDADLRGADLSDADLSRANVRDASLRGASLRGANLSDADLSSTNLRHADLRDANLRHADLRGASLRGANLRGVETARVPPIQSPVMARLFLAAIDAGTHALEQFTWRETNCKITLCLCGFGAEQAPEAMEEHGITLAGAMAWPAARRLFYASNKEALEFLETEAAKT